MEDIKKAVADRAAKLLSSGRVDGFLALKQDGEMIGPHLFTKPEELDQLNLGDGHSPGDARYPLVKVLYKLAQRNPKAKYAILVRGCDERALRQLISEDRACPLSANQVIPVGFSCPEELAQACRCHKPWPDALMAGKRTKGAPIDPDEEDTGDLMLQLRDWFKHFDRCVKCLGCKSICPVCVCQECTVAEEALVPQRELPPPPSFLLTRAMHMVDRCVYCGLCESACPAGIPLKDLYRMVARASGSQGVLPGQQAQPPLLRVVDN